MNTSRRRTNITPYTDRISRTTGTIIASLLFLLLVSNTEASGHHFSETAGKFTRHAGSLAHSFDQYHQKLGHGVESHMRTRKLIEDVHNKMLQTAEERHPDPGVARVNSEDIHVFEEILSAKTDWQIETGYRLGFPFICAIAGVIPLAASNLNTGVVVGGAILGAYIGGLQYKRATAPERDFLNDQYANTVLDRKLTVVREALKRGIAVHPTIMRALTLELQADNIQTSSEKRHSLATTFVEAWEKSSDPLRYWLAPAARIDRFIKLEKQKLDSVDNINDGERVQLAKDLERVYGLPFISASLSN